MSGMNSASGAGGTGGRSAAPRTRETEHTVLVAAPAERLYGLVADVSRWPVLMEPCVRARRLESVGAVERIEVWAQTNGTVTSWTSRRALDPAGLRIAFRQERSTPPVAAMSGEWSFCREGEGRTRVVLSHRFSAVAQEPAAQEPGALDWIAEAVDRNSVRELAALGAFAELGVEPDRFVLSFTDRLELPATTQADAYDFVYRSDLWPQRLPHVGRVVVREEPAGVQYMEMDTVTPDGRAHTTGSIRVCEPRARIAYKQTVVPALLSGHSGVWEFEQAEGGTSVTSSHTVAVDPAAVERVLGPGTTLEQACAHVRDALGANSRATMRAAGGFPAAAGRRA